jgi:hypothetical protein
VWVAKNDRHEVALVSSVDSEGFGATGSSTTLIGHVLEVADEFLDLLFTDESLTSLFSIAFERINADRLERHLKRFLKIYAIELRQETSSVVKKEAVQLVLTRTRYIARCVRNGMFRQRWTRWISSVS